VSKNLSPYKFQRIAEESLRNSLRLHADAMLLFEQGSYPSAFQLSVLSLEELAKAKWVDHYYYTSITNEGFPDPAFEQKWLKLLYLHPEKQYAFLAREVFNFSPKFVRSVQDKKLELKKQRSIYVGLDRVKGKIDTQSRISVPVNKIKEKDAKSMISLVNQEFVDIHQLIQRNQTYWGIWKLDSIIEPEGCPFLWSWPYKSGLKSTKWRKEYRAGGS
jgi:AbiV family abortive infection protein